jgi:PncC family amidohydrolase
LENPLTSEAMGLDSLELAVSRVLTESGVTLAVAESCTGGLLCSRLTDVPGSSAFVEGGVVVYSYEAKERLLGVDHDELIEHGAVSEETALAMAAGVRRLFRADVGIGITGIAGPGGGMPGKPVGLVYIALADAESARCERYVWQGDRLANKQQSADAALQMILDWSD